MMVDRTSQRWSREWNPCTEAKGSSLLVTDAGDCTWTVSRISQPVWDARRNMPNALGKMCVLRNFKLEEPALNEICQRMVKPRLRQPWPVKLRTRCPPLLRP